jgi:Ca2+-binding RTX toxin-like protein
MVLPAATYLYASGDGSDEIDDDVGFLDDSNVDALKLTDLNSSDIALSRDGDNLKVTVTATGDVITIDNQFLDPDAGFGIEEIDFADGSSIDRAAILASLGGGGDPGGPGNGGGGDPGNSGGQTITGTSGDDDLTGTSGNDTLDGGLGNDSLNGGDGSDTYLYRLGDGSDGIGDQSASTTDVDTLKFVDINFADVTFSPSANDVLATINSTGDVVSIYWQFLDASAGSGLEKILFADGISMDLKHGDVAWQINGTDGNDQITSPMWGSAEIFNGGKGNDFLDGTAGSDTYLYASGDGSDEIDDDVGFLDDGNVDALKLTDLNSSDIALSRDGDNLKVTITATGDVITIDNQFADPDAGFGIEEIDFADGSSIDRADIESATSSSSLTMARAASIMTEQPQALDHIDLRPIVLESSSSSAQPTVDWNGGAWGGSGDGVLAIDLGEDGDAGGDGVLNQAREVSFSLWADASGDGSAPSNLDGLRQVFDSNSDGVLDTNDALWSEFRVWHDANENGITDPRELESLSDAGVKLINLMPAAANQSFADGSAVSGTGSYASIDGSRYLAVDTSQWAQTSPQRAG